MKRLSKIRKLFKQTYWPDRTADNRDTLASDGLT